jgi:hypothetical protein
MRTSQKTPETISTIGIDVGKNTFHLVGLDKRGAIVLQQKVTRHQLGRRLSNTVNARRIVNRNARQSGRPSHRQKPTAWLGW